MQLTATFLALFATQALSVNMWSHPDAEAECGALGVMEWDLDTLPGYNPAELRKCREHPLSLNLHARDEGEELNDLSKRACLKGNQNSGCSDGWCWKRCGKGGKWCWLAKINGTGDWQPCSQSCRGSHLKCARGNCKPCGCGC
jgi:hypothetical protein